MRSASPTATAGAAILTFFFAGFFARRTRATGEHEESTDDSEILQKLRHLHLATDAIPMQMEHDRREHRENDEHPGCRAPAIVEEQHQPSTKLENNRDDRGHQRYAPQSPRRKSRKYHARCFRKIHEKPEPPDDEQKRDQHPRPMFHDGTFLSLHTLYFY